MNDTLTIAPGQEGDRRYRYIGGSDAHHVMGLEPYGCALRLVREKARQVPDVDPETEKDHALLERGHAMEGICAEKFTADTGLGLYPADEDKVERRTLSADAAPFLHVHPDALMFPPTGEAWRNLGADDDPPDTPGVWENKTAREWVYRAMQDGGPQLGHVMQLHHAMALLRADWGVLSVTWPDGWRHMRWLVRRDPDLESEYLERAALLWRRVQEIRLTAQVGEPVPRGLKPDPGVLRLDTDDGVRQVTSDDFAHVLEEYPRLSPKDKRCRSCPYRYTCQGDAYWEALNLDQRDRATMAHLDEDLDWQELAEEYLDAKPVLESATMRMDAVKAAMKRHLSDRQVAQGAGLRVYFRPQVQRRIDTRRLKKEKPDLAAAYEKPITQRPLRIYEV